MYFFHSRYNIKVVGISSDADSRLLTSMKTRTNPLFNLSLDSLLNMEDIELLITFIQDTIHLLTKLRNRLLKPSIHLPLGFTQITVSHLKLLIDTVDKNAHGLVKSDICPEDKQNFRSLQKCFDDRVLLALKDNIPGSEGTIMYLKMCRNIYTAFEDNELHPLERIRRIWQSTFFIRAWRCWILKQKKTYTLKNNFITHEAYACLELNAYGLLQLIVKMRAAQKPEQFLPMIFSSQMCEDIFRKLRSMTSMYWTRINFNLLELLHMVGRLELINDIVHDKLSKNVSFPRVQKRTDKFTIHEMPTNGEILKTLEEAKASALFDATQFGMIINEKELCCACSKIESKSKAVIDSNDSDSYEEDSDDDVLNVINNLTQQTKEQ